MLRAGELCTTLKRAQGVQNGSLGGSRRRANVNIRDMLNASHRGAERA